MIVTKCDTKSAEEQEQIREYMRKDTKLTVENIVCIAAKKGEVDELLQLIASVSANKNRIVADVIERQTMTIQKNILEQVLLLLNSSKLSTNDLDAQIAETKRTSGEMQARIRRTISELEERVDSVTSNTVSGFNARIFNDIEEIVKNPPKGQDLNKLAYSNINRVKSLMFANFKSDIMKELRDVMRNQIGEEDNIAPASLNSAVQNIGEMENLSFTADLSLPELQQMNKMVAGGIKAAAVFATVGVVLRAAGGIAAIGKAVGIGKAAAGAKAAGTVASIGAKTVGTAAAVDTATDIASMISNQKTIKEMRALSQGMNTGMRAVDELDQQAGQVIPATSQEKQGLLEKLVSTITEHTSAKPQRQRLINDYIVFNLQPEFRQNLERISNGLIVNIETLIREGSEDAVNQIKYSLEQLKTQKLEARGAYQERIAQLESYKQELQTGLRLEDATAAYPL
jgi:hypothetical protein